MRARVEIFGQRIHIQTSAPYRNFQMDVPGAYWSAKHERWTSPISLDVCRNLRRVFGPGSALQIGPELSAWAERAKALETSQHELGKTLEGVALQRVPEVQPRLAAALSNRPYQAPAARFIAQGRSVLVADTPGLGKTTETIAGVIESGVPGPYLIVGPVASMVDAWEREIRSRLDGHQAIVVAGVKAERDRLLDGLQYMTLDKISTAWVIINIEMIRTKVWWVCPSCDESWIASDKPKSAVVDCGHDPQRVKVEKEHLFPQLFDVEWGAIVMDECQRSLIRTSGTPTQTRAGAKLLETRADGLRVALSGTPMRGKPQRLFGTLQWLRPKAYSGYWAWLERYWNVKKSGYGGARVVGEFREDGADAFRASLNGIMIRRTKAEVSPDLPPKAYMGTPLDPAIPNSPVAVWLTMDAKQQKACDDLMRTGSARVENEMVHAVGVLAEMTRLKQFASAWGRISKEGDYAPAFPSNKYDWMVQFLAEHNIIDGDEEEATGKVVIVSQFTQLLELFRDALQASHKLKSLMLTGKITGAQRQTQIDVFNDPDSGVDVMFLNTLAGGVAVTLDAADDMVFLDETYVPDDQEQAEGRIDNRRPEEKVVTRRYWYLKSIGSVDEAIARMNLAKDKDQKQHLDGQRSVEYAREVFSTMRELRERSQS